MDPISRWRRPWEEGPAASSAHQHRPNLHPADRTGPEHQRHVYADSGLPNSQALSPVIARPGTTQWKEETSTQSWTGLIADNTPSHVRYKEPVHEASPHNKRRRLDYGQWPCPATGEGFGHPVPRYRFEDQTHEFAKTTSAHGSVYHPQQSPQMTMNRPPYFGSLPPNPEMHCCDSNCKGRTCSTRRIMLAEILHLIQDLHGRINQHANPAQPSISPPKPPRLGIDDGLAFALETLRVSAGTLQRLAEPPEPKPETRPPAISNAAAQEELRNEMKQKAEQRLQASVQPPSSVGYDPFAMSTLHNPHGARRQNSSVAVDIVSPHASPTMASCPHSGPAVAKTSPPAPGYQASRMLPSPTSSNIPPPSTNQSMPSPPPSLSQPQSSAHLAHLAELQHQISLKTLALQTLRQEYDALLAKLDRQRTKCAALEKKFAVSDVELNTLTVDKEELEAKTQALEQQVDELREARDEARRDEVKTGEQYRTIVEMASRLQKGAAEEKRMWAQERGALLKALRGEQEAPSEERPVDISHTIERPTEIFTSQSTLGYEPGKASTTVPPDFNDFQNASNQVIEALRVEVARLRARNQSLETVLQRVQAEIGPMKTAACTIAEAQTRMEEAAGEALRVA